MALLAGQPWKLKYTPEDGDLVRLFYIPALEDAVRYNRLTGYFNASALSFAARGIEGLVDHFSLLQYGDVLPAMALAGGHETDAAVAVFVVIPGDEVGHPGSCVLQTYERTVGEAGPVLAGFEQRIRIGVVVSPSCLPDDGTTPSPVAG